MIFQSANESLVLAKKGSLRSSTLENEINEQIKRRRRK
jgi:hypothetical protein